MLLSGVEHKTFRLLVRVLFDYHLVTGESWEQRQLNKVHGTNILHTASACVTHRNNTLIILIHSPGLKYTNITCIPLSYQFFWKPMLRAVPTNTKPFYVVYDYVGKADLSKGY